jgi:AAA15 family ATPase/GTPase
MKICSFRIKNYRSIVDTGWRNFSADGTTIFVGQNESGKTSILEALASTFSQRNISDDDCRSNAPLPEIFLKINLQPEELDLSLDQFHPIHISAVNEAIHTHKQPISVHFFWKRTVGKEKSGYSSSFAIDDEKFEDTLNTIKIGLKERITAIQNRTAAEKMIAENLSNLNPSQANAPSEPEDIPDIEKFIETSDLAEAIYDASPDFVLFDSSKGLLPNSVDIESGQLKGNGSTAAQNFLKIADLSVKRLMESDPRTRNYLLKKANERISKDFLEFWTQKIGHTDKLELECELEFYSNKDEDKAGDPHLVFWISDGFNRLYPKQRSLGVRWFISFYLQIRASEKSKASNVFLLDEPGANLHAKAQADVLKLINQLSPHINIIYSTHSPNLIEYKKLYRVYAVQRKNEDDDSPTILIDAHHLGAASTDTLSPILAAMGADLSTQNIIQKNNNVILEEMSGFYYLHSFWKLARCEQEAYFIAATGVNKVEGLANMFRGWGLEFIIAVDDDPQGREVYNKLKRELFGDIENLTQSKIYKFTDCKGIEDAFSGEDFKKHVLKDDTVALDVPNSEIIRRNGRSKPITGYLFMLDVENGTLQWDMLDDTSKARIQKIVEEITKRLQKNDEQHVV